MAKKFVVMSREQFSGSSIILREELHEKVGKINSSRIFLCQECVVNKLWLASVAKVVISNFNIDFI